MKELDLQNYIFSKKHDLHSSCVNVGELSIGGEKIVLMGGPCVVDNEQIIKDIACELKSCGVDILRGGAYKPRTSPYSFQGIGDVGLAYLKNAGLSHQMPVISEILGVGQLEVFLNNNIDIIQIGARNMQNYELLKAVGKIDRPILLKRGFSNTIEELLLSAEYILKEGNQNVILCERGIRTFENMSRNTLDVSAIPIIKRYSHLPVVVDPSHAGGRYWLVKPLALAAIAAGADGLIIEAHTNPRESSCDPEQTLTLDSLRELVAAARPVSKAVGRYI